MIDIILKNIYKAGLCDPSANKRKQKFRSKNYEGFCLPCKVQTEYRVWSWHFFPYTKPMCLSLEEGLLDVSCPLIR